MKDLINIRPTLPRDQKTQILDSPVLSLTLFRLPVLGLTCQYTSQPPVTAGEPPVTAGVGR